MLIDLLTLTPDLQIYTCQNKSSQKYKKENTKTIILTRLFILTLFVDGFEAFSFATSIKLIVR